MVAKNQRQYRIAKLISQQAISSQQQIVDLLAVEGISATQATVSRDLDELGAIKVRGPQGQSVYAIPDLPRDQTTSEDYLRRVLSEWLVEVAVARDLVLAKTPPGCAHVVAAALDRAKPDGVLGTVAGDDTLLIVVSQGSTAPEVAALLHNLAGLPGEPRG
ncbi:arginine repressor, ArgR [Acidimicrobium ferrooxidans DSM 10331]|uniref:Arginine repressor n=1 Tax=Acidimicrobium ferrooxidans (strain DSM 10331 / JCM 15462 / NBRC 103882 / ICP) TaxID=525909 RepID=C7M0R8_ACIFD|nr:arginine repressor [Acidimicrobium ferrooxidans]ACU54576.1 arginine repressor, ArgR [Acidimicrobium ferrooxidans DSM 10331]